MKHTAKISILLLLLLLAVGILASCSDSSHTHVFGDEWVTDEENHWQKCTECGKTKRKAAHVYDSEDDSICNVCGYNRKSGDPLYDDAQIKIGTKVTFGSYPQSEVTDEELLATLNARVTMLPTPTELYGWTSYGYYILGSNSTNYMWYLDLEEGGETYRAVYFSQYRPSDTANIASSAANSSQDNNGYTAGKVYWFRFEPLTWTVLAKNGEESVILLCDVIVDAQHFQHNCQYRDGRTYVPGTNCYCNDYSVSEIRQWLNETFLQTAFSEEQVSRFILTSSVDISARSTSDSADILARTYGSDTPLQDRVFLLSEQEVTTSSFGFAAYNEKDPFRCKVRTAYAKAQGAGGNSEKPETGSWGLRSPARNGDQVLETEYVRYVSVEGTSSATGYYVFCTTGVVPAIRLSLTPIEIVEQPAETPAE